MPAFVVEALREHRIRQDLERELAGDLWQETGFVFTSLVGTPLDGSNVTHKFQELLARSGLPRLRFHDLRHTCASLLVAMGVPLPVVRDILGHSQISITADTYSHVTPLLAREAMSQLDGLFGAETRRGGE